jgi:hypothetical protein
MLRRAHAGLMAKIPLGSNTANLVEFDANNLQRIYEKRYENITRSIRLTSLIKFTMYLLVLSHGGLADRNSRGCRVAGTGRWPMFGLGHPRCANARPARSHQSQP